MRSNQWGDPLREAAMEAIEDLGYRGTIGDVAAASGLSLRQAESALKALAREAPEATECMVRLSIESARGQATTHIGTVLGDPSQPGICNMQGTLQVLR